MPDCRSISGGVPAGRGSGVGSGLGTGLGLGAVITVVGRGSSIAAVISSVAEEYQQMKNRRNRTESAIPTISGRRSGLAVLSSETCFPDFMKLPPLADMLLYILSLPIIKE